MWRAQLEPRVAESLPHTEEGDQNETDDHWRDHGHIGAWRVGCADDANECKHNARNDESHTDVIQALPGLRPRNTFGMLWWLVKQEDCDEGEELENEAGPVDVLPSAYVDSVLYTLSALKHAAKIWRHTLPTIGPMITIRKTKPSERQIPMCRNLLGRSSRAYQRFVPGPTC